MKRGKTFISVISVILSTIIILTGCSSPIVITDESGTGMTKAEWIIMLAEEFELSNCVEQKPYFSDVTSNDEYFVAVQSCAEWDIIERKTNFNPDEHVVNAYAMITGVKAIGLDLINHTAEGKSVEDDKSIIRYFALHNMDVATDEPLTEESAKSVLDTLSDIYSSLKMEQTVEYQLFDNVVQLDETQIQMDGNQAIVTDENIGVGSIIYTEPSSQYPTGRAVQITAIDGKTATIEDVEEEKVLKSADIIGTFAPEILDLHDENWNLELIENPDDMSFDGDSKPIITYLGKTTEQQNTTNTDFERHVNLGDVWISLSNKVDPNVEVKGKMCLSDLTVDLVFKMKSKNIKEAHVSFSAVIKFQVSVSGKAEKELLPFSIPLKIAGIIGGEIKVTPKVGISGTATLELSTTFSEGCTYKEGAFPKFFKKLTKPEGKQSFKAQAYVNAKIVLFAAFIAWDLFDVGFETSGTAEATRTKTDCLDICVYWSFSAFVNSDKSLLGMLGVKMAWDIFDKDNTPLKKNMHIENGEVVDKCTKSENIDNKILLTSELEEKLMGSSWEETFGRGSLVFRFLGNGEMNCEATGKFEDGYRDSKWGYWVNNDGSVTISDDIEEFGTIYDMKSDKLVMLMISDGGPTVLYNSVIEPYETYGVSTTFLQLLDKYTYSNELNGTMIITEVNNHGKFYNEYGLDVDISGEKYYGEPVSNEIMFFRGEGSKDFWLEHAENNSYILHIFVYSMNENGEREWWDVNYTYEHVMFE